MSGRPRKEREEEKSTLGSLSGGLLLGAGAAAVGFLAYKLFERENPLAATSYSSSSGPRPDDSFSRSSRNTNNTKARMEGRKKGSINSNKDINPEGSKCIICFENEREVLFEPCNHVCACEDCAEKIEILCPICRHRIVSRKPIFL